MARRILRVQKRQVCPACLDRDAVNLTGRPRVIRGRRLTDGCEVCGGDPEVTLGWGRGEKPYDPWIVRVERVAA